MAGLDELFAQIPVADIANKLGADEGEVNNAIKTLVPALVGGLQQNVESNEIDSSKLESAVTQQAASGLLDGGVNVNDVDEKEGDQLVAHIFGGNNSDSVASALAGTGGAGGGLVKQLLPILAPIVLAYIGKQFAQKNAEPAQAQAQSSGGGLGDILGSILGGASQGSSGGNNPLGSILGSVLGGGQGNAIGEILGGLLGGKK
ncbi:hypothetical protein MMAG44476_06691 [Mycolicibacterium mageritense DSM 44476 = CIP 104973]|uniref:DUF937 domain-containing protein n=1 Tax=Mycolicibacterium mageritense TaxID=53462 RepID=A0AAI8U2Y0_MYCME|nr:DUF937 domain-containing protein [Mycolicibacterium mageritense]MBN3453952.1 DUF937 domain-containing protein [Mycobacterium sp. DSM 3803]MCC9182154.1 DUF937 domain-containing protein [Mycolicibacterium mageritense]TXI60740.1 MAG: DUF937 domain-containing protein [Mycolicibacterium mageritense]CDO26877.1 hypothetical protein BN978_07440 [Mycolicibacterium mageritense DSM 44476 = CIP 104973]BBX38390.1 hypothetical protein MMAGJ_76720 [Mycolicibacterium mageritense]